MASSPRLNTPSFEIAGQNDEPWVRLADGRELAAWTHWDEIRYNQQQRQIEKYRFFVKIFDFIKDNRVHGDYHEYGCHRVRTFRMALTEARRHELDDMDFFAFDSFKGLPPVTSGPSVEIWQQGALTTTVERFWEIVKAHGIYTDRIRTVEGYYSETLTAELRERFKREKRKIALATVDCDLYESAVPVFAFIEPLLQEGSVLYIDDLFAGYRGAPTKGVARAFLEFQKSCAFQFVRHCNVGWWGRSYIAYQPDSSLPDGVL